MSDTGILGLNKSKRLQRLFDKVAPGKPKDETEQEVRQREATAARVAAMSGDQTHKVKMDSMNRSRWETGLSGGSATAL